MAAAWADAGRAAADVQWLAVSKTFDADAVREAAAAGQTAFGENYIQEGVEKIATLSAMADLPCLTWHCIGPIQSNKTRLVAEHFDWVHTIDRLKIAQRLSEQRAGAVAQYLQAQGVQQERLITVGGGKRYPIASNDTEQGRALNRRVEIRLLPLRS